jgi:excisionase family DNA binding protein
MMNPATANGPLYFTRAEVAQLLRVSLRHTYDLQRQGVLPPVKIGAKSVRFRAEDVQRIGRP